MLCCTTRCLKGRREYVQLCRESAIKGVSCAAASPTIAATSLARVACSASRSAPEVFAADASASSLAIVSWPSFFTTFFTLCDYICIHCHCPHYLFEGASPRAITHDVFCRLPIGSLTRALHLRARQTSISPRCLNLSPNRYPHPPIRALSAQRRSARLLPAQRKPQKSRLSSRNPIATSTFQAPAH